MICAKKWKILESWKIHNDTVDFIFGIGKIQLLKYYNNKFFNELSNKIYHIQDQFWDYVFCADRHITVFDGLMDILLEQDNGF